MTKLGWFVEEAYVFGEIILESCRTHGPNPGILLAIDIRKGAFIFGSRGLEDLLVHDESSSDTKIPTIKKWEVAIHSTRYWASSSHSLTCWFNCLPSSLIQNLAQLPTIKSPGCVKLGLHSCTLHPFHSCLIVHYLDLICPKVEKQGTVQDMDLVHHMGLASLVIKHVVSQPLLKFTQKTTQIMNCIRTFHRF